MVQLQRDSKKFKEAGVQIVGLSPDSVDKLKKFAKQKSITYPLLADPDGTAIKSLGLQNKESKKKFLPHPGVLIIGTDGVVDEKLFKESFKARHDNKAILAAAKAAEPEPATP